MKKLIQEDFVKDCNEVHNHKYDYSLVKYKNTRTKIEIICVNHGIFKQLPKNHKNGQGCPRCSLINYNLTKSEFINLCKNKDLYNYDLVLNTVIKSDDYVKVIKDDVIYIQLADNHRNGIHPKVMDKQSLFNKLLKIHNNKYDYYYESNKIKSTSKIKLIDRLTNDVFYYSVCDHLHGKTPNKLTLNYFKLKSSEIHNNKYDYSLIKEIINGNTKVNIICPEHGMFSQRPTNHLNLKDGCPKCVGKGKWNTEYLISEFKKVHLDVYDYSLVEFKSVSKKVKINCKTHGIFEQTIYHHLNGQGCKLCKSNSKGEEYIASHLEKLGIKYIRQHGFDTCRYINRLNFDFYLPELNICIEFDGVQHFKPVKDFGGEKEFEEIKKRDECKNIWCVENSIKLLRIKYDNIKNIPNILKSNLMLSV